jgi:hypothetical protein
VKGRRVSTVTCSAAPEQFDTYRSRFEETAKTLRYE